MRKTLPCYGEIGPLRGQGLERGTMTRRMTTPSPLAPQGGTPRYRDRIYDDPRHDPYQDKGKYTEPTVCTGCHAIYHQGRWAWGSAPEGAHKAECPACHRVREKQPAGYVTLAGAVVEGEREELVRIARNVEKQENARHPLHRIMGIEQGAGDVVVTTTDVHLPQRIGEAIRNAHKGHLDVAYAHDEYSVRVHWRKA
jgi:hypothetical protein